MHGSIWATTTIALAFATTTACAADATIEPGLYEIVTKSAAGAQTERKCLSVADFTRGLQPADLGKDCRSTRSVVSGGRIDFAAACPDMAMTSTGSYTSTSYAIDGRIVIKGDEPMTMESHISAKKVGACKAG